MSSFPEKHFDKWYWTVCSGVFICVVLRCIFVPFSHDEVATFNFYIQSGNFLPFLSHPDANGHFLLSCTSWIFFKLVGSSPVALRMPCILAFVVLCYGVFKMNKLFSGLFTKIIFSSAFILSFNFISFYSLCRGYGMSMALLVLSLYYFFVYLRFGAFSHLVKYLLFSQLALAANLTLIPVLGLTALFVIVSKFRNNVLFKVKNMAALFLYLLLLAFWIRFGIYLKEQGALYYGGGESYWKVTFVSLIETILFPSAVINVMLISLFVFMGLHWVYKFYKERAAFLLHNSFAVSFFILCLLITGFYVLKRFFDVNYPEDRTGLFFYVFFIISLCLMINTFSSRYQAAFLPIAAAFIWQFVSSFNIVVHPWRIYETMPASFFSILKEEQQKSSRRITIGGHRVREFFYAFLNYKSNIKLNHMTAPEALQMNCDYALAYKQDKPFYDKYYDELAQEHYWDFTLIKRKTPLERKVLFTAKDIVCDGANEYCNAFERTDTTFNSVNPLLAEFEFSVDNAPEPFNAWLVLQIDGTDPNDNQFMRVPLNLVRYDWNGARYFTLGIVSGNLPLGIRRIVAYLWNIDKKQIKLTINTFTLYQLNGEGVTEISHAKI